MTKSIILLTVSLLQSVSLAKDHSEVIINGKPIICEREAYNCPSASGNKPWKRLKNCKEVMKVWETCKRDVHGLDRDKDGIPCEEDCSP